MPLAKSITPKRINVLRGRRFAFSFILIAFCIPAFSQDNSPYSRYGLGDLVPSTNINSRGMAGISAAYSDFLSINYNNPASYGSFQTVKEATAKKISYGRAMLDIGINLENRTLSEPNNVGKFTASNALFSHVMVAVPLRPKWGLSFGLRPVSRISYKQNKSEQLIDPNSGLPIDSAITLNEGDGGSYMAQLGTGFRIDLNSKQSLSFGLTGGFLFGKKDNSIRRTLFNDSIAYNAGNFQTKTTFNNILVTGGIQYRINVKRTKESDMSLTIGAYGNLKQNLNASQDKIRETYVYDQNSGYLRLDSVQVTPDIKGKITYPASVTGGFILEKLSLDGKSASWLVGVDVAQTSWKNDYKFYGQSDPTLRNKFEVRVGGQIRPVPKSNYFSNVVYRAGVFFGPDYVNIGTKLPVFGATLGFGLPIKNYNRLSPGEFKIVNLALEFIKRGNNDNLLKENLFRLSVGFSLSDFWFVKKKYD